MRIPVATGKFQPTGFAFKTTLTTEWLLKVFNIDPKNNKAPCVRCACGNYSGAKETPSNTSLPVILSSLRIERTE
jgi:hypothetical protein